jgi:hypothetical protein
MTKIAIVPNAAGTGTFTIEAPNSNSNRTLTLPDAAGEIYGQGNILGTVSQSAGVPTGAIIERGSNANGEFVKYADGTLICTQNFLTPEFTTEIHLVTVPNFPTSFVNNTYVTAFNVVGGVSNGNFKFYYKRNLLTQQSQSNAGSFEIVEDETRTSVSQARIALTAIGRWY